MRFIVPLLAFVAFASPALATGAIVSIISAEDQLRLEHFDAVRVEAVKQAEAAGSVADLAILKDALAGAAIPLKGFDATGPWRCRMLKLGGAGPGLVVYPWFACKISDDGAGWFLEKTSGSQRTSGRFYDDGNNRMIYLGARTVNNDPKRKYRDDPLYDDVAYATRTAEKRLVLQFPEPRFESKLDMLVLERK